uniref:hypothetical protein n=1 Tax=Streptococcus pluranimalium TaxID=82348 RepID=UPI003F691BBA
MELIMNQNDKIIFYGKCNVETLKRFLKEKLEILAEDLAVAKFEDVAEKAIELEIDINRLEKSSVHIDKNEITY